MGKITIRLSDMTQLQLQLVHFRDDASPVISCSVCTLWSCWKWGARLWQTPSDFHSSPHTASLTLYSGPSECQWCLDSPEHNKVETKKSLTWRLLLLFNPWHAFLMLQQVMWGVVRCQWSLPGTQTDPQAAWTVLNLARWSFGATALGTDLSTLSHSKPHLASENSGSLPVRGENKPN